VLQYGCYRRCHCFESCRLAAPRQVPPMGRVSTGQPADEGIIKWLWEIRLSGLARPGRQPRAGVNSQVPSSQSSGYLDRLVRNVFQYGRSDPRPPGANNTRSVVSNVSTSRRTNEAQRAWRRTTCGGCRCVRRTQLAPIDRPSSMCGSSESNWETKLFDCSMPRWRRGHRRGADDKHQLGIATRQRS
jgi:hypothetical protein